MNRLILGALTLVVYSWSMICFAEACEQKEYAQYKDEALTPLGRSSLAHEYCRFEIRRTSSMEMVALANQYKKTREAEIALRDVQSCTAAKAKISTALTAAKATKAIAFMNKNCEGDHKPSSM